MVLNLGNTKFVEEYLTNIKWNENSNDQWQVEGLLKKLSNQYFKFDIRFLKIYDGIDGKLINSQSKADKILFEDVENWILIDAKEFIEYMKINKIKKINLIDVIDKINWNIILPKKLK